MDNSYPRDNRLIRCKCDNIRSSPCLAPRCRLILILTLEGLIVSQLKGYLSWVQTVWGRSGSIYSVIYKTKWGCDVGLQYERTKVYKVYEGISLRLLWSYTFELLVTDLDLYLIVIHGLEYRWYLLLKIVEPYSNQLYRSTNYNRSILIGVVPGFDFTTSLRRWVVDESL